MYLHLAIVACKTSDYESRYIFFRYRFVTVFIFQNTFQENRIKLEAILPIQKDEEISTRYTTPQLGTMRRQQLLQNQWYFSCQCKRCLDPYELGSLTNSVMCPLCQKGAMVPKNPTKLISQ